MARAKVKLARILNESKRQATLKKRKEALIKKLQTICMECRAESCMMICDGPNDPGTNDSMVWPSRQEAAIMISRFLSLPEHQRSKKMITHEKFLESILVRENNKLQALKRKNDQMEMEDILHKLLIESTSVKLESEKLTQTYFYIEDLIQKIESKKSSSQNVGFP